MGFNSSKFNISAYNSSGFNTRTDWCDDVLTKLKNAFIATNTGWSLETAIETIGTNTSASYGCRTLQMKNARGEFVRIWCFGGTCMVSFVDNATASGGCSALKCYKGNLQKISNGPSAYNNYFRGCTDEKTNIVIGVSDSSINKDFGMNLGLKCPLFMLENKIVSSGSYLGYSNSDWSYSGTTLSVITDGSFFGIMQINGIAAFYAYNMITCAQTGDTYTAGYISSKNTSAFATDSSDSNVIDNADDICSGISSSTGSFDFGTLNQSLMSNKSRLAVSESSTKLPTGAIAVIMYPNDFSGSTATGIVDGVGLKGWINTNYIRPANNLKLPATCKGMTYGNGRWLCVAKGTLVAWDSANESPYEASNGSVVE